MDCEDRLSRYMMKWTVGMPMETQLSITALILSGSFDVLPPELKIMFAHGKQKLNKQILLLTSFLLIKRDRCILHANVRISLKVPARSCVSRIVPQEAARFRFCWADWRTRTFIATWHAEPPRTRRRITSTDSPPIR